MRPVTLFLFLSLACGAPRAHLGGTPGEETRVAAGSDRGESFQAPHAAGTRKQAARLLLELKFREVRNRLDTLWEDSLHVSSGELPRFRRAMHTAAKVLAEAEGRLGELKRLESEAEHKKWESLRGRMERTLFGLTRYLTDTEAYWLPAQVPGAAPLPESLEDEL